MKIAVVTPYHSEPIEKIRRCHDSVRGQTVATDHFIVSDGSYISAIDGWGATHIVLPVNCNDSGNTPRIVGMSIVAALGYDALLFLDADNWFEPVHVATLLSLHEAAAVDVVTCSRNLRRLDGSLLNICAESDGVSFCDFNCYLFMRPAFECLRILFFNDVSAAYYTDRSLHAYLRDNKVPRVHSSVPTVNYETTLMFHYIQAGEDPPPDATQPIYDTEQGRWRKLRRPELDAFIASGKYHLRPLSGNKHHDRSGKLVE